MDNGELTMTTVYMKTGANLDQLKKVSILRQTGTGYLVQDEDGWQYRVFDFQLVWQ